MHYWWSQLEFDALGLELSLEGRRGFSVQSHVFRIESTGEEFIM